MKITAKSLRDEGASCYQVTRFAAEWPEGCEVTEATLLRAAELHLDLDWFAMHFLPDPLWTEYGNQVVSRWYRRQEVPLWAEYERQVALLIWQLLQKQEGLDTV